MARRRSGRKLDAVLLLDKPQGVTSNGALQKVRNLFRAQKAGHTGSLDPMATGLLPVCFGEATKFAKFGLDADKGYVARARLGETTETGDAEGQLVSVSDVPDLSRSQIEEFLLSFKGEINQIPSMYSALKYEGRPLYEYARQGIEVPRSARKVTIHEIALIEFDGREVEFSVRCSKGTYIRTLAEDLGARIGCGAHLVKLRRTMVDAFSLDDAVTMEALQACRKRSEESGGPEFDGLDQFLKPVDTLVAHFSKILLEKAESRSLLHGQPVKIAGSLVNDGIYRLYQAETDQFLGLGKAEFSNGWQLVPVRLIAESSHSGV